MRSFLDVWGRGHGPIVRLAPFTRLLCTFLLFAGCLIAPLRDPWVIAGMMGLLIIWLALCGIPIRLLGLWCGAAAMLFIPVLLLTPWVQSPSGTELAWADRLSITGGVALKGLFCMLITAGGTASLQFHVLPDALLGLLPKAPAVLMCQIAQQTAILSDETGRLIQAMKLRGVTHGLAASIRVACSLPVVWMVRVLDRAERTAAAMTIRGYTVDGFSIQRTALRPVDWCAILTTAIAPLLAAVLRYRAV
jgi:energy-coupling factor transporter transmembrane protein EcfT